MSEKQVVTRGLEETEVQHVDNNEIVSPVQEVEHEENGGEQIHGNPGNIQSDQDKLGSTKDLHISPDPKLILL